MKTSEGQEIVASRYGIDTNVSVGEKVRCCFLPTDAVLVDREEDQKKYCRISQVPVQEVPICVSTEQAPYG